MTRAAAPFWPTLGGVAGRCLQLPTTLPTFDELIGVDGMDAQAAAEHILQRSRSGAGDTHVFTLHAELEGQKLFRQFEFLLARWHAAGVALVSLHDYHGTLSGAAIARHELVWGEVAGRSGTLAMQGAALSAPGYPHEPGTCIRARCRAAAARPAGAVYHLRGDLASAWDFADCTTRTKAATRKSPARCSPAATG